MKKQFWALALALLLALSLAACGEKEEEIKGSVASESGISENADASEESEEHEDVGIGSLEGGVYTSEFLGIRCTLDSEWTFATEAELAEMINLSAEQLDDQELAEQMKNSPSFVDMCASKADGLSSVNVVLENVGVIYGMTMDENDYLELGMEKLEESLQSMGMENISTELSTVEFAGAEHVRAQLTASYSDVPFYEELICIKKGSYMGVITLGCYYENNLPALEQLFSAWEPEAN